MFINAVRSYRDNSNFIDLKNSLDVVNANCNNDLKSILDGLLHYIKDGHKQEFINYCESLSKL